MAYARPNSLIRLLDQIENLEERYVHISVDGSSDAAYLESNRNVKNIIEKYSLVSKHKVTFDFYPQNLGLKKHFSHALTYFFSRFHVGIVLEDDMNFEAQFVAFVDSHINILSSGVYWSICGHNPATKRYSYFHLKARNFFFETDIHTIWGWAANRESVEHYLNYLNKSLMEISSDIADFARKKFSDPFTRKHFCLVWQMKLERYFKSNNPNWDNLWVVSGWSSGKSSIMPRISLVAEHWDQSEGQTHYHKASRQPRRIPKSYSSHLDIKTRKSYLNEFRLLKVWGITPRNIIATELHWLPTKASSRKVKV